MFSAICLGLNKKFAIITSMRVHKRGIVLISILFLTLLATFFLGALIQLNPSRLQRTVHDESRDQAEMAAKAGIDYALTQFKSDLNWSADANDVVVNSDDLVIREDHGNLLGWMRTDNGGWAGFRLRFNHQDGPGGGDGRDDPDFPIASSSMSLNNLNSPDPTYTQIENGAGTGNSSETGLPVPGDSLALVAEGLVANNLDPLTPATLASATTGKVRRVEGLYVISNVAEGQDVNSVLMAGGDSNFTVGDLPRGGTSPSHGGGIQGVLSLQADSQNTASLRSKGNVTLERRQNGGAGYLFDPDQDAEVKFGSGAFDPLTRPGVTYTRGVEGAQDPFLEIAWDKVSQSKQSTPIELPAGVYIFSGGDLDSGRSVSQNVKYYEMSWEDYRKAKIAGTPLTERPVPAAFADRVQLDAKDVTITSGQGSSQVTRQEKRDLVTFEKDVDVQVVGTLEDLTIIPERGARQLAGDDGSGAGQPLSFDQVDVTDPEVLASSGSFFGRLDDLTRSPLLPPGSGSFIMTIDGQSYPTTRGDVHPDARIPLLNKILSGGTVTLTQGESFSITPSEQLASGISTTYHNVMGTGTVDVTFDNSATFMGGGHSSLYVPGTLSDLDDRIIPRDPDSPVPSDETVPQDVEIVFSPEDDAGSAFIRTKGDGDIYLGTHVSGEGGGIVAGGSLDVIGLGIDLHARAGHSERDGVALYARKNVNISTYDERRNKYWDVDLLGSLFTYGDLHIRLGEEPLNNGKEDPTWGLFNYEGAIVTLGTATANQGVGIDDPGNPLVDPGTMTGDPDEGEGSDPVLVGSGSSSTGSTTMIANGIRLFYDPRYLAPFLQDTTLNPTFTPLSVVVK